MKSQKEGFEDQRDEKATGRGTSPLGCFKILLKEVQRTFCGVLGGLGGPVFPSMFSFCFRLLAANERINGGNH